MKRNQAQTIIFQLQREIETRKEAIETVKKLPINLFAQAFPEGDWSNSWGSRFEFTLPFSFELIQTVKLFVAEQFPEFVLKYERQHVWDEQKAAGHFLEYETTETEFSNRTRFEVGFRTGRTGTTCVLNVIGEKKMPVYEVICAAGADEMAVTS